MKSRWLSTWKQLNVDAPLEAFTELCSAYSSPERRYHTLQHLAECFSVYDSVSSHAASPSAVELALWYHDAVYDTRATDNEAASARLARTVLTHAGLSSRLAEQVAELILATRHTGDRHRGIDAKVLLDADLSILGAPKERFAEYERQIREEYHWVPEPQFRAARATILRQFLARPTLFHLAPLRDTLENQARKNLVTAIAELDR